MKVAPYLNFDGNCEEAVIFYQQALKAELEGEGMMRFSDMPDNSQLPEEFHDRILHVGLKLGENTIMASDTFPGMGPKFTPGNNVTVSLEPESRGEADRLFQELSEGGKIIMPMEEMFFGYFGSFEDKFGINWMIVFSENPTT